MYDVPMPFAPDILSAFEAMGLGDEFKFPASAFAELEGCDMSDVCMVMNLMPMVMSGQEHTAGPHMLRESFDELRKQMAPYEKEHGLPLIDNLVINIFGLVIPTFKSVGCFSDFWKRGGEAGRRGASALAQHQRSNDPPDRIAPRVCEAPPRHGFLRVIPPGPAARDGGILEAEQDRPTGPRRAMQG